MTCPDRTPSVDGAPGNAVERVAVECVAVEFSGEVWEWRGPAPYYFVTVPERESREIRNVSAAVTYGWGMVPVSVKIGDTGWTTSLWPKDGRYVVPLKDAVRKAETLTEGRTVMVRLTTLDRA